MSKVYVTADLHLGHEWLAKEIRGFDSVEQHDDVIMGTLRQMLNKRDMLWVLGDICWTAGSLMFLEDICKMCDSVRVLFGNHDAYLETWIQQGGAPENLSAHGPGKRYKNFMFSHYPIPAASIDAGKLNVHGHVHKGGFDEDSYNDQPWLNVNCELWSYKPFELEDLRLEYATRGLDKQSPRYMRGEGT